MPLQLTKFAWAFIIFDVVRRGNPSALMHCDLSTMSLNLARGTTFSTALLNCSFLHDLWSWRIGARIHLADSKNFQLFRFGSLLAIPLLGPFLQYPDYFLTCGAARIDQMSSSNALDLFCSRSKMLYLFCGFCAFVFCSNGSNLNMTR